MGHSLMRRLTIRGGPMLAGLPGALFLMICCLPVLGWMLGATVLHWGELTRVMDAHWQITLASVGYAVGSAVVAVIIAFPVAVVLGRGRDGVALGVGMVMLLGLLQPSIVYTYGWVQIYRIAEIFPQPQSWADVMRCVLMLAGWLWPIPAALVGLTLRRMDVQLQQQALMDGALWRVTLRHLLPAMLVSGAAVIVLALQEFSVFDYSGIRVVATEVRAIFISTTDPSLGAARGLGTALPVVALVLLIAGICLGVGRSAAIGEGIEVGRWPRRLNAGWRWYGMTVLVLGVTLALPIAALVSSLRKPNGPVGMLRTYGPEFAGSLTLSGIVILCAAAIAVSATIVRLRGMILLSLLPFLIGGQLVAIALIRLYNRPWLDWIYNQWPMVVIGEVALFGWVALVAGRLTWTAPWRALREIASVDGATAWQVGCYIIWPLAWPICLAAALLVGILSLGEVPAMVLLTPLRPPTIVPWLVQWVHMQRSDEMIEGSLLLLGLVMALSAMVLALAWIASRRWDSHRLRRQRQRGEPVSAPRWFSWLIVLLLLLGGCGGGDKPQAIWCETGTAEGQVIYPRVIAYSKLTDSFFIIDRLARVQHIDRNGQPIHEWRMPDWRVGKPVGASVAPDGRLWVPDTHYHRVIVYEPDGTEVLRFGSFGYGDGQFMLPTDVAFDEQGHAYVAEYGDNDRIQVFDQQGNYLRQFGSFGQGDGQFARPQSLLIHEGLVYVADACNHRIAIFRTDGTFVRNIGEVGTGLGQFRFPYGIAMDNRGRLVVCEFGNNRVQLIDPETGRGLATWGIGGREPGQLAYPWGVAVDQRDRVVAVDAGNNRLQVFRF